MLTARHRHPSRGSAAARTATRVGPGPMLTPPPPEPGHGRFQGQGPPIQNLVGTAVRELFTSMLDAATAVRLGDNSSRPRYFGTVLPSPQTWRSPSDVNSEDSVRAGIVSGGNAPQAQNKVAGQATGPPRIAASLPVRGR